MSNKPLIIVGASARAAAFSAYRAGYTPYWLDQFGDEDLWQRFHGSVISDYPKAAVELITKAPDAPFMYTGALENHPCVLEQLCQHRTLLGNPKPVCFRVRDPSVLYQALRQNRVPCPQICITGSDAENQHDWLIKPLRSAGGIGIGYYEGQPVDERYWLQQYLQGESFSAVFVGSQGHCSLLGVTRQLVGLPEFHAAEFSYCGSIGPLELSAAEYRQWQRIGEVISGEFKLMGLFGVDAIKWQDRIYPVEVNPRYTASVEVLELALDYQAIKFHCEACDNQAPVITRRLPRHLTGKAVLFAPRGFIFAGVKKNGIAIADIPVQGTEIKQGHPVLTVIMTGNTISSISQSLKRAAESIYKSLKENQSVPADTFW